MKTLYLDKNNYVHGVFPLVDITDDCVKIELSDEQYEMLTLGKIGYVWYYNDKTKEFSLIENFTADYIRRKRVNLLNAFDKYKTNVAYGIKSEDGATHTIILNWYKNLLDLNPDSIRNIPDEIKYYL